jgi:hypothetical protein
MPPRTNRGTRSADQNNEARRSLANRRESKVEDDSDSLMSGVSDDDDEGEDEDDGEQVEIGNRRRNSHIFNGELKMPPYEHTKRQLSQLFGVFDLGEIIPNLG